MKTPNPDIDPFIEALRGDLPTAADEARVRSRLLAAGALVTSAAVTTPGAAASLGMTATSGTAAGGTALGGAASGALVAGTAGAPLVLVKAGLVSKLLVLPVAAKVGIATSLALAVAATSAPLVLSRGEPVAVVAPASGALPAAPTSHLARAVAPAVPSSQAQQPAPVLVPPQTERAPSAPARREPVRATVNVAREAAPAERAPARQVRASSLAEETRLMEQAMLAVGAGEGELARRWLDEHARRFPEGLLARERERAVTRLREAGDDARATSP